MATNVTAKLHTGICTRACETASPAGMSRDDATRRATD
jgi:hypothetical protein